MKIIKQWISNVKDFDEEERTLTALVSTGEKDRVGEYIPPDQWKLDNYNKNPVILWAHDYSAPPVAKALWTKADKKGLIQKIKFAGTDFAKDIFALYKDGFLNAFSVGFNAERDKENFNIFKDAELLEVSCVPVPCNANALVERMAKGYIKSAEAIKIVKDMTEKPAPEETENQIRIRIKDPADFQEGTFRTIDIDKSQGISSVVGKLKGEDTMTIQNYMFDKRVKEWTIESAVAWVKDHEGDKIEIPEEEGKSVVPFKSHDLAPEGEAWDGPAEIAAADVEGLKIMSAWFDSENPDIKSSYKLPHHKAAGYATVWKGVAAAMAALLGARGGVDIPEGDKAGVYNHLKKHYAEFEKEAPEMRSYTSDELDKLFPEEAPKATEDAELKTLKDKIEAMQIEIDGMKTVKEGRVLSTKNRELIGKCVMALQELLDATDPANADEDGKSIDKRKNYVIINRNNDPKPEILADKVAEAIKEMNIGDMVRREIRRMQGTVE